MFFNVEKSLRKITETDPIESKEPEDDEQLRKIIDRFIDEEVRFLNIFNYFFKLK